MIELGLEPYCQDCMYLEPVNHTSVRSNSVTNKKTVLTVISCKNCEKCEAIADHIDLYYKARL